MSAGVLKVFTKLTDLKELLGSWPNVATLTLLCIFFPMWWSYVNKFESEQTKLVIWRFVLWASSIVTCIVVLVDLFINGSGNAWESAFWVFAGCVPLLLMLSCKYLWGKATADSQEESTSLSTDQHQADGGRPWVPGQLYDAPPSLTGEDLPDSSHASASESGLRKRPPGYKEDTFGAHGKLNLDAEVTSAQMLKVADTALAKWREIGVLLKIRDPQLDDIEDKRKDMKYRLLEVLNKWNAREGRNATVRKLLEVCKDDTVEAYGKVLQALKSQQE